MKNNGISIKKYHVLVFLLLLFQQVSAQINIQVKILPPYQSHIAEYASRPDLILMTLTNTSDVTQNIQLRGHISGDNGILVSLKEGYRSASPIEIGPMQTRSLNANDLAFLFNYSNLNIVGITEQDFVRGAGLPEGNYDFCIQAFDYYESGVALSPEEPMGCTMLTITNLEPPTIISPYDEQEINNMGVQSFPVTWSTPPGAPPSLEYHLVIVEILGDQNPHDAINNTRPFFERTIHTNTLLYGPADPALSPGRTYAMVVEAKDPFGKLAIRNHGRSEVVVFTYGENEVWAQKGTEGETALPSVRDTLNSTEKEFATHKIKGSLKWAFRQSEESLKNNVSSTLTVVSEGTSYTPLASEYLIRTNQNINPKLVPSVAISKKDPTISTNYRVRPIEVATTQAIRQPVMIQGGYAALSEGNSGTATSEFKKVSSQADPSTKTFPLENASFTIQAVTTIKRSFLIGTAETDAEGNFQVEITDPKFLNSGLVDHLSLRVNMPDFEGYEYRISLDKLQEGENIEIGDHILIAKTYRFNPSFAIESEDADAIEDQELEVVVYREASELEGNTYLENEGNLPANQRTKKQINGREFIMVAKTSTNVNESPLFAPLFYSGEHLVEVIPLATEVKNRSAKLSVDNQQVNKQEVLVYSPTYKLQLESPAVSGKVVLQAGADTKGLADAYVQVSYNEEDLLSPMLKAMPLFTQVYAVNSSNNIPQVTSHALAENTSQSVSSAAVYTTAVQPLQYSMALPAQVNVQGQSINTASNAAAAWMATNGNIQIPTGVDVGGIKLQYDINAPYTVKTDSTGSYYIGNLPILKSGAEYTIRLIMLPSNYGNMPVTPETRIHQFSAGGGKTEYKEFVVTPNTVSVAGIVLDDQNQPVRNARLSFGGSSKIFESDSEGKFKTDYFGGNHTLHVRKTGYIDYEQKVSVGKSDNQNLGNIAPVQRMLGKVRFIVHDYDNKAELLSGVEIALNDTSYLVGNGGEWLYEGISGESMVTFSPDPVSGYVAAQHSIQIEANGKVTEVYVGLEKGVRVYGKVSSSNATIAGAEISVEGKSYLKTISDNDGLYSFYVPAGEEIIQAGKSGYFTDSQSKEMVKDQDVELSFLLKDGDGKNISTLLGFAIQLEESKEDSEVPGGNIWKGKFVDLQAHPTLFKGTKKAELAFEKLKVTFDESGNAIPMNDEVVTKEKTLALKLFDYLPIILEGDEYITVRRNPDQKGSISGKLRIDGNSFVRNNLGIKFTRIKDTYVTPHADTRMVDVEVFHQDVHNSVPELTFNLIGLSDTTVASIDLYGFNFQIDLAKSKLSQKGFTLSGSVTTPSFGIIDTTHIKVRELAISTSFGVESLLIDETALPTLKIKDWSAELGTVALNEDGFEFGGKIKVNVPKSDAVEMAFEKLRLAKDALYGGVFHLPEEGLNVYNIIALKALRDSPLALNRVGETQVYSLTGSGEFEFPKLITQKIKVNSFHVQTDGAFHMEAPVDIAADLGFAKFDITGMEVSNPEGGKPFVGLLGKFKTDIKGFTFEAGNIRFMADSRGEINYSISRVKAKLNVPILAVDLELDIIDDGEKSGFAGKGSFNVPKTSISADVAFHYSKFKAGGVELGASFVAGASIPIGALTIGKLGGGFSYSSSKKSFAVNIEGAISVAGLSSAVQMDSVRLGVLSNGGGIVVKGSMNLVVGETFKLAKAEVLFDSPNKLMEIMIDMKLSPMPKLAEMEMKGLFAVKWDASDTYAFYGVQSKAKIFGNTSATVDYAIAFNLKRPKTHTDNKIRSFFTHMQDEYNDPVFSGMYLYAGFSSKDEYEWSVNLLLFKPKVTASYNIHMSANFITNFSSNTYFFRVRGNGAFQGFAGIRFRKKDYGITGGISFCADISGGYTNAQGWFFDGSAGGNLVIGVGNKNTKCNDYKILGGFGVKICADVQARLQYSSSSGLSAEASLGSGNDNCN